MNKDLLNIYRPMSQDPPKRPDNLPSSIADSWYEIERAIGWAETMDTLIYERGGGSPMEDIAGFAFKNIISELCDALNGLSMVEQNDIKNSSIQR